MTKLLAKDREGQICRWCRRPIDAPTGPGRPRLFCKHSCRQRDFEARRRAAAHGLDESEILVARSSLNELRDEIYVLACAVDDADADLLEASTATDYHDIVRSLLESARRVAALDPGHAPSGQLTDRP